MPASTQASSNARACVCIMRANLINYTDFFFQQWLHFFLLDIYDGFSLNSFLVHFTAFGKITFLFSKWDIKVILRTNPAKTGSQKRKNYGSSILNPFDQLFHFKVNATNWQNDKISNL